MVRVTLQERRVTKEEKEYITYYITFPKQVADFLGLKKGDEFELVQGEKEDLILKRIEKS